MRTINRKQVNSLIPGAGIEELRRSLNGIGQVLAPGDAEEPILGASVRRAVFDWLAEINARDALAEVNVKPRTSALLSGPPGCGKTTLAHHLSARLGIPMVNVGAEHIVTGALGGNEKNIANLFECLTDYGQPVLLFLDEIDAIGGKRRDTAGDSGGAVTTMNSTLTVLLRKIEEFEGFCIAATNRSDTLDQALWRRFGMHLEVALPDDDARFAIIKRYGEPFALTDDIVEMLTAVTEHAAPSLLRQLMENMKRLLVLRARGTSDTTGAASIFAAAASQVQPHPDYENVPWLWQNPPEAIEAISKTVNGQWPPARLA